MSMHVSKHMNISDISIRASSYGMKGVSVDGNDIVAVYTAAVDAKTYVKKNGPMLLVANTYRIMGHSKSDANVYRTKEEIEMWRQKDPIKRMKQVLLEADICTESELAAIEGKAAQDIEEAVRFAEASPEPSLESALEDVYAEEAPV